MMIHSKKYFLIDIVLPLDKIFLGCCALLARFVILSYTRGALITQELIPMVLSCLICCGDIPGCSYYTVFNTNGTNSKSTENVKHMKKVSD
jgi:hypothetical protein